jgi:ATP-dependent RNA helicase DeaD
MLSMGFYEEVSRILDALPEQRQVLLLSATLPHDIERLAGKYLREPETVDISGDDLTVEGIDNILYFTNETLPKPRSLLYLLAVENPQSAIIFCNTREDTTYVGAYLRREGFDAEVINSDLSQTAREQVMGKIKQGKLRFLVATDIAARGIDISDLSHVINYSLPESPEVYLHRVGRTGRVGRKGVALSLIEGREINTLRAIKRMYRVTFEERKLPTPDEYRKLLDRRRLSQLAAEAAAADTVRYAALAERVIANEEATHLVAYLLKSWDDKSLAAALSAVSATEPAGETLAAPEAEPGRERERGRDRDRDRGRRRGRRGERERGRESAGGEESREGDRGRDRDRGRERNRDRDRDRPRDRDRDRERDRDRPADASRAPRISPYARELVPEGWEAVRHESDEIPEEPAPEAAPSEARPAVVKVHLNVGYADGFRESQITQAIAEIAGIPATEITKVTPHRRYSFFCVPAERLEQVLSTVQGREVQGKTLTAEKAKERR